MSYINFTCCEAGKKGRPGNAFRRARNNAFYWHGHAGNTGTIAEVNRYRVVTNLIPVELRTTLFSWEYIEEFANQNDIEWRKEDIDKLVQIIDGDTCCAFLTADESAWIFFGQVPE